MRYAVEYEEYTKDGREIIVREKYEEAATAKRRAARLSRKLGLVYALVMGADGKPSGQVVYFAGGIDSRDGEPVR